MNIKAQYIGLILRQSKENVRVHNKDHRKYL
jgi:hypothetical protein